MAFQKSLKILTSLKGWLWGVHLHAVLYFQLSGQNISAESLRSRPRFKIRWTTSQTWTSPWAIKEAPERRELSSENHPNYHIMVPEASWWGAGIPIRAVTSAPTPAPGVGSWLLVMFCKVIVRSAAPTALFLVSAHCLTSLLSKVQPLPASELCFRMSKPGLAHSFMVFFWPWVRLCMYGRWLSDEAQIQSVFGEKTRAIKTASPIW